MSYAATPTSSVEVPQARVRPSSPMAEQLGCPGRLGAWVSAAVPTLTRSRLGPPLAVVAVARILLLPAGSGTFTLFDAQVFQSAVAGKETAVETTVPLTEMSIGRSTVVPLAYRRVSDDVPAVAAPTVNSTEEPLTLV